MAKEPTTFEDLYDLGMTYRTAHVVAAVLPNLPNDERIIDLQGYGSGYYTETDEVESFKRRHTPVVPDTDLYRVTVEDDDEYDPTVTPVPHPFRTYKLNRGDFVEIVPLDPAHYDFSDTDQASLSTFGGSNPHFDPYHREPDDEDDTRKPNLPVQTTFE